MTQLVQFEGTTHAFPDDFKQADISAALDQVQPHTQRLQDKQPAMQGDAAGAFKKQIGRATSETSQSAEAPLESEDGEGLFSGHR